MTTIQKKNLREAALELVRINIEAEPAIIKAYLFPADDEIRLIYVDPTTSPLRDEERIAPYYFGSNQSSGWHYTSAVALVLPDEDGSAPLPEGWGDWSDADIVHPKPGQGVGG